MVRQRLRAHPRLAGAACRPRRPAPASVPAELAHRADPVVQGSSSPSVTRPRRSACADRCDQRLRADVSRGALWNHAKTRQASPTRKGAPVLRVMVARARLMPGEDAWQGARRLGPVDHGDRDQADADDDGEQGQLRVRSAPDRRCRPPPSRPEPRPERRARVHRPGAMGASPFRPRSAGRQVPRPIARHAHSCSGLVPGNIGVTSGVATLALRSHHVALLPALSVGVVVHAAELVVEVCFGLAGRPCWAVRDRGGAPVATAQRPIRRCGWCFRISFMNTLRMST